MDSGFLRSFILGFVPQRFLQPTKIRHLTCEAKTGGNAHEGNSDINTGRIAEVDCMGGG